MYIHSYVYMYMIYFYVCISIVLSQPATGPSRVCQGSGVVLHCVIVLNSGGVQSTQPTLWSRNGLPVIISQNSTTATTIPNHKVNFNVTTRSFTELVIVKATLEDNNALYTCTVNGSNITSSLVLNVTGV